MSLVSIIIPCYNYGWLLSETLDSVLNQSHAEWECIVVDDGSSDNTQEIAKLYATIDKRIKYVYQNNGGMSAARNHGLRLAKGDYIQFLDADDLLAPRKLELQVNRLVQVPGIDILYGDMRYFRHGAPTILGRDFNMGDTDWMVPMSGSGMPIIDSLLKNNVLPINAALTSAELVRKVGGFNEGLRYMEDWDFWLKCALAGATFSYDANPEAWVLVRLHPTSTSNNHRRMHGTERQIREQLIPKLDTMRATAALQTNNEAIERLAAVDAVYHVKEGNISTGLREFLYLATSTKKYKTYGGAAAYWLRYRATRLLRRLVGTTDTE